MTGHLAVAVFVLAFMLAWTPYLHLNTGVKAYATEIIVPDQYSTIQAAINHANDGDTVFVKAGTYYEHVVVNTTIALIGENRDTVIIDGGWTGVVVNITRNDVNMTGFTVRRSGTGGYLGDDPPWRRTAGVYLQNVSNCRIFENKVVETYVGIQLEHGANRNVIANNTLRNNTWAGIGTHEACWNSFLSNEVTDNLDSIMVRVDSNNNTFSENIIAASNWGVTIDRCYNNTISGNHIMKCLIGIFLPQSEGNRVYHNSFANNTNQASCTWEGLCYSNTWDDGYPSGGNYWSDCIDNDTHSGAFQNETGNDGIGDAPYVIDAINTDCYPLTKLYGGPVDVGIVDLAVSPPVIMQGLDVNVSCDVINYGAEPAVFNATFDANGTVVFSFTDVHLESRGMTVLGFVWNTSGADVGSYTVIVRVSALENESDLNDNTRSVWMLVSSLVGDINGDGKVDMKDIGYTARRFMCIPGDPLWDPVADLNNDDKINMTDIGTVARHFGEHYP